MYCICVISKNVELINELIKYNKIAIVNEENVNKYINKEIDMLVIEDEIVQTKYLEQLCNHSKYILLQDNVNLNIKLEKNSNVITFGFNHKSTVTVSSISEENIAISASSFNTMITDFFNSLKEGCCFRFYCQDTDLVIGITVVSVLINQHGKLFQSCRLVITDIELRHITLNAFILHLRLNTNRLSGSISDRESISAVNIQNQSAFRVFQPVREFTTLNKLVLIKEDIERTFLK